MAEALFGLLVLATGIVVGYVFARWRTYHERRQFDVYRQAMLDDWRDASDKIARMRGMFRRAKTLRELREMLQHDESLHLPLPTRIVRSRSGEP